MCLIFFALGIAYFIRLPLGTTYLKTCLENYISDYLSDFFRWFTYLIFFLPWKLSIWFLPWWLSISFCLRDYLSDFILPWEVSVSFFALEGYLNRTMHLIFLVFGIFSNSSWQLSLYPFSFITVFLYSSLVLSHTSWPIFKQFY